MHAPVNFNGTSTFLKRNMSLCIAAGHYIPYGCSTMRHRWFYSALFWFPLFRSLGEAWVYFPMEFPLILPFMDWNAYGDASTMLIQHLVWRFLTLGLYETAAQCSIHNSSCLMKRALWCIWMKQMNPIGMQLLLHDSSNEHEYSTPSWFSSTILSTQMSHDCIRK